MSYSKHYKRPIPNTSRTRRAKKRGNMILLICMIILLTVFAILLISRFSSESAISGRIDDNDTDDEQSGGYFRNKTVCLDPGHGFEDTGTSSEYLGDTVEKDITLRLALYLKTELEKKGANVVMTHDGKFFPKTNADDGNNVFSPQERSEFANTKDIDLFISLHVDSFEADGKINGMRVYYCDKGDANSALAAELCEKIATETDKAKLYHTETLIKPSPSSEAYYVTKHINAPSVLIETGFCTNKQDAKNMLNDEWMKKLAKTISRIESNQTQNK